MTDRTRRLAAAHVRVRVTLAVEFRERSRFEVQILRIPRQPATQILHLSQRPQQGVGKASRGRIDTLDIEPGYASAWRVLGAAYLAAAAVRVSVVV